MERERLIVSDDRGYDRSSPGEHLLGYHASGVAAVVRALAAVPVVRDDVVIDLGSGLGRVPILAALLTGATARGVEIQSALVERARACAASVGVDVRFDAADARDAAIDDGTVFYLYTPFVGPVLDAVLERLRAIASQRAIVVCALGFEIRRSWLAARALDDFWLTVYDSAIVGVPPRPPGQASDALLRAARSIS